MITLEQLAEQQDVLATNIKDLAVELFYLRQDMGRVPQVAHAGGLAAAADKIAELEKLIEEVKGGLQLGIRKGYWTQTEVNEAFR